MIEESKATARRIFEDIFPALDVDALAEVIDVDLDQPWRPTR